MKQGMIDKSLRPLVVAWSILILTFGLFPLWAVAMHLGLQDWDVLAASYWNILPKNESLNWTSVLPNFIDRFLHNVTDFRPFEQLYLNVAFIVAHGQWWYFYLFQVGQILVCVWLIYSITTWIGIDYFGKAAVLIAFVVSNKPQLTSAFNDVYFTTAIMLLIFFCLLRAVGRPDVTSDTGQKSNLSRHISYLLFLVLLIITTFTREYMIAFVPPILLFIHLFAFVRRERYAHVYMVLPWVAQAWLFYRLLSFSKGRDVQLNWSKFAHRLMEFSIKLLPMRLDGLISVVLAILLAAGVSICVVKAISLLGPWLSRRHQNALPFLLAAIATGAVGIVFIVSIPNDNPTWSRYVVPSATLLTIISVIGLNQIPSVLVRRSAFIGIIIFTPLLALPDRYHDQTMNLHYMSSINSMFQNLMRLQKTGTQLVVDNQGDMFPENAYTIKKFFSTDGARYYNFQVNAVMKKKAALNEKLNSFYLIVRDRAAFDFKRYETEFPGYSILGVEGFMSTQKQGFDRLLEMWTKIGRTLGQREAPVNEYFWPDIARDPGYYVLHMARAQRGVDGFEKLVRLIVPVDVPRENESKQLLPISKGFGVGTTGWYFICEAPDLAVNKGSLDLTLASRKTTLYLEGIAAGEGNAIKGRPFKLVAGQSYRFWVRSSEGQKVDVNGSANIAICPLTVTEPTVQIGALY